MLIMIDSEPSFIMPYFVIAGSHYSTAHDETKIFCSYLCQCLITVTKGQSSFHMPPPSAYGKKGHGDYNPE